MSQEIDRCAQPCEGCFAREVDPVLRKAIQPTVEALLHDEGGDDASSECVRLCIEHSIERIPDAPEYTDTDIARLELSARRIAGWRCTENRFI